MYVLIYYIHIWLPVITHPIPKRLQPNPMTRNPCKGSEKDCLDFHGETTARRWERAWQSENGTDLVCVWCQQLSYIFKNAWCNLLSTLPLIIIVLLQARRNRTWIMVCLATFNSSTIKFEILAWLQGRWGFCAASMVSFQATATSRVLLAGITYPSWPAVAPWNK